MTLAESTVSNAIRYSMQRFCFANIIIAGPIYAGKKSLARLLVKFFDGNSIEPNVTIFEQDCYYKEYDELEDAPFDVKNVDAKSAFNTKAFISDVGHFYEKDYVMVKEFNKRKWIRVRGEKQFDTETVFILETKYKRRINIFVGPHAIELIKASNENLNATEKIVPYEIPEVICIYLNADHHICMEHRRKERFMFPNIYGEKRYQEYSQFVKEQTEKEIEIQKEMADIVINCK